jgi:hypothetical protein
LCCQGFSRDEPAIRFEPFSFYGSSADRVGPEATPEEAGVFRFDQAGGATYRFYLIVRNREKTVDFALM